MSVIYTRVSFLPSLCFLTFVIHVVGVDELTFQVDLETAGKEGGAGRYRVVFVAEVIPFLPFVDEDAEVGGVTVETVE